MAKKTLSPRRSKSAPRQAASSGETKDQGAGLCPIVGIGASAGGLQALEEFLKNVPRESGMAFVIVQHLDPDRKGAMAGLLQRSTTMKVIEAGDGTPVRPDNVYVIPPNRDLSILHGVLHPLPPPDNRNLRLPIDFFLTSLAQDRQEQSIGVILSGMGSDGTWGARAIKEKAGLVLVQQPETAEFDRMPRSALEAGLADIVAPPGELPGKILAWLKYPPLASRKEPARREKTESNLDKVVVLLRAHTGNDFSYYKRNTLHRRVERRMGLHHIMRMADYIRFLQENPQEISLLFKELLIGVTSFFRDPEAWEQLRHESIPSLLAGRPQREAFRAWVPGCSTGEEAYSLAMVLKEVMEEIRPHRKWTIQIFATDLDRDAIDKARLGYFPVTIADDVTEGRLSRFFTQEENGYRVRPEIREMVIFAPQNLIMDPPFTKLDMVCCRNLLIYLTPEMQKKLIPLFHYSLRPGGLLFQGSAETVGEGTDLFVPLSAKQRIFQRSESLLNHPQVVFPSSFSPGPPPSPDTRISNPSSSSIQTLADQLVLQRYAPPAVLTSEKGDIIYVSGRTGKYLEPAAGKANWNLFAMAREGLRYELSAAFSQALRQKQGVTLNGVRLVSGDSIQLVNVTVQQIDEPGPLKGLVMIVLTDVPAPVAPHRSGQRGRSPRIAEMELELLRIQGEARAIHDAMQTSQEELRSANEELQSTNEELQSTNEELTTSKEEMQSMNEELQAVNAELQLKVDELSRTSDDMRNLLNSTDIATLFLDRDLKVQRFTPQAAKIIKLIPADAGRPVTDLVSDLDEPIMAENVREVLRTLIPSEKTVGASHGRWFTVRIMPYRTVDDRIDGVVITFANITAAKILEAELRDKQTRLEKRISRHPVEPKRLPKGRKS